MFLGLLLIAKLIERLLVLMVQDKPQDTGYRVALNQSHPLGWMQASFL